ncbi:adenylyltransferase/cytidyltransferase family protein [Pelagibacterales bacterium]|nr:adenylyltransferase/cytidyltransferase family protein [Pelagibacterales bacterium]
MKNLNKEYSAENLIKKIVQLKKENVSIGFTNGCFDLLHKGHIYSISEAKKKCDYLIIAINSDISVSIIKGPNRPIDDQVNRVLKLSKLDDVDAIIIFYDDNPLELIKDINPDILFKGADYKDKEIIGSEFIIENGGKVELIDILNGYSTTNIIKNSSN